jgi:hypothetical protein
MKDEPVDDFGGLDGLDRRLNKYSLVVTLIAIPAVFILHSFKASLSIGAGAILSYINFIWFKRAIDFVVMEGASGAAAGRRALIRFVGRYVLIALVLYVTIRSSILDIVFILAGLLIYVLAILIECVYEVSRVLIKDYRNGRT